FRFVLSLGRRSQGASLARPLLSLTDVTVPARRTNPGGCMMWIVRLALRRTYTFVVVALLIAVLGAVSIYRMSTDIFPNIDIPVVSVVWQFAGMPADEIESRLIYINERVLTASVNDIEHIESQSLDGVGVIRIYFQP